MWMTISYCMFWFTGLYNIQNGSTIEITKADINASFRHSSSLLVWTFKATTESRIIFTFSKFGFYWSSNYHSSLEIGDGLVPGDSSRLAVFRGLDLPSNVTSVSSSAWLSVQNSVYEQGGEKRRSSLVRELHVSISGIPNSGQCELTSAEFCSSNKRNASKRSLGLSKVFKS